MKVQHPTQSHLTMTESVASTTVASAVTTTSSTTPMWPSHQPTLYIVLACAIFVPMGTYLHQVRQQQDDNARLTQSVQLSTLHAGHRACVALPDCRLDRRHHRSPFAAVLDHQHAVRHHCPLRCGATCRGRGATCHLWLKREMSIFVLTNIPTDLS